MRLRFALRLALVGALDGSVALPRAYAADWREVQVFQQAIQEADRQGDFKRAAHAAEQCVAITTSTTSTKAGTRSTPANPFCLYYLSSALRSGRGVPRDEGRAFAILNDLVATDLDGDAALTLAEDYLDGSGVPHNPIEAGVLLWRVDHGAWSIYSDYWGMCMNCEDLWRHEKIVARRVDHTLAKGEKLRVDEIVVSRFPALVTRARHRDRQIAAGVATPVLLVGGLLWLLRRRRGRSSPALT